MDLKAIVDRLAAFPNPKAWSIYLRRPLLHLTPKDGSLLGGELDPLAGPVTENIQGYLDRTRSERPRA